MDFIEKLRKKPKPVKKTILYVTSFILFAIIILFWVSTLSYRFTALSDREKNNSLQEELRPLSIFKENISRAYSEVSKGLGSITEDIQTGIEEESEKKEETQNSDDGMNE